MAMFSIAGLLARAFSSRLIMPLLNSSHQFEVGAKVNQNLACFLINQREHDAAVLDITPNTAPFVQRWYSARGLLRATFLILHEVGFNSRSSDSDFSDDDSKVQYRFPF